MESQIWIKILLVAIFVVFAIMLLLPGRGARHLAVRRIALVVVFLAAVVAIAYPELLNTIARFVGVGRGTDLLLYAMVVVLIGNIISTTRRHRHIEREVTRLARALALAQAERADESEKSARS
jgi:hypothetical protein